MNEEWFFWTFRQESAGYPIGSCVAIHASAAYLGLRYLEIWYGLHCWHHWLQNMISSFGWLHIRPENSSPRYFLSPLSDRLKSLSMICVNQHVALWQHWIVMLPFAEYVCKHMNMLALGYAGECRPLYRTGLLLRCLEDHERCLILQSCWSSESVEMSFGY